MGDDMKVNKLDFGDAFFQPFITEVKEEVKAILDKVSPSSGMTYEAILAFTEKGSRRESEKIYFQRRKEVVALGLYLQMNNNEVAMSHFKNLVWDICQEYSWSLPAHFKTGYHQTTIDLFAAETAHMMAEFMEIFAAEFEPLLLTEIRNQIWRRVLTPFLEMDWSWENLENNWSAVCAGAIGMTVLVLDVEPKEKKIILDRCLKAMDCFLKGYGEDGCCTEGVSYWVYGFGFYLYFAEAYERYLGIDLLVGEKLEAIASFPGKLQQKDGRFVMFSDAVATTHIPTGIQSFLKRKWGISLLNDGKISSFHFDHCYRWAHLSRILKWRDPDALTVVKSARSNHYFPDAQWFIFKNDDLFFAAKGGHNGESHNHNDLGSFVFGIGEDLTLVDFGAGAYSADYFGDKRYTYIQTRSNWHSVPTLNDQEQMEGAKYQATVEKVQIDDSGCYFKLDLSEAYPANTTLKRSFQLNASAKQLRIVDETDGISYQANFVTYEKPMIKDEKILWQKLQLIYHPNQFQVNIEEAVALNHFNQEEKVYAIRLNPKKKSAQYEFIFTEQV